MTLEEIYYIGQTIAVVAILGSLGAIWVQLRKDHALARANAQQVLLQHNASHFDILVEQPSVLASVQKCLIDYDKAPSRQKTEFTSYLHKQIAVAEAAVFLAQDGLIASTSLEKLVAYPALLLGTPGGQENWVAARAVYGSDVVAAIEGHMRDHPSDLAALYAAAPFLIPDDPTAKPITDGNREELGA
ncbi:MAG: hypothetical protein ABJP48_04150 [Erythrobacter sp.]